MPKKRKSDFDFQKYKRQVLRVLEEFKVLIPEEKGALKVLSNKKIRGHRQNAS